MIIIFFYKKRKLNLLVIFFLLAIVVITINMHRYDRIVFITRNLSIFGLFAFIVYRYIMYRYKSISQGKEKKTYYKIGALSVFAIIIVLFSRVQISIIDSYKPRLASCSYFDNKNLLLYETMFIFNDCPELEFEILDNGMSHYKGIEVYEGGIWTFGGDLVIDEYTSAEILFDVYVQYDGEELVSHSVQITLLAKLSGNGKTYIYYESLHSETTIFNDEHVAQQLQSI